MFSTIKGRLISTCIFITAGILAIIAVMQISSEKIKVNGPVYQDIVRGKDLIADILPPPEYIIESYFVVLQALAEKDASRITSFHERLKKLRSEYDDRHAYWTKELPEGRIRTLLLEQSYKPAQTFYDAVEKGFFPALEAHDRLQAEKLLHDVLSPAYESHRKTIDEIVTLSNAENAETEKRAARILLTSTIVIYALSLLLFASVLTIFYRIICSITGQLRQAVSVANTIASGDLTTKVHVTSRDETGQLLEAMRIMAENLRSIINQVSGSSSQVATASNQLITSAEQIATGAEEVAAQAGTVATAGEEMSATSADIAQNCQLAAEGAQLASNAARNGAVVVEKTVAVMGEIATRVQESARTVEGLGVRSDQIGAIVGTIEDIADQTNLLALNAAIEAARAGEQGRGFAVVADEVRALAERTTRATREIGEMIKAIQAETRSAVSAMEQGVLQVENGTVESARSGEALREILEQVNAVAMQVSQIATAAEQQTATTSEIAGNMQQITEVVMQTSLGAHESATAARQLGGTAEELERLVHQFKI
ncbi:MAG: methyl-accepting chemotaxis protein [Desulfuromonadales bacterium]|nr:methyl-accepting chemotaxis protein [Desulfuromonadales bacterium]